MHVYLTEEIFDDVKKLGVVFRKLHRQFGHSEPHRLVRTILQAYPTASKQNLRDIANRFACETCGVFARPPKRPVAANNPVAEFNHTIGADVFFIDGVRFLHVMCMFTQFSKAVVIANCLGQTIIEALWKSWFSTFQVPKKIKLDLGPEFDNAEVEKMRDIMGCELTAVPGQAHWSQGSVENKHGPLRRQVKKMMQDKPGMKPGDVIEACVAAKNATVSVYGYSPHQLVFGNAANLPHLPDTAEADDLPDKGELYRGYLRDKLQLMQDARIGALREMARHKINRAMAKPVGTDGACLKVGDAVEWFTEMPKGGVWRGPGKLVLHNPPMCMILSGGRMYRRHTKYVRLPETDGGVDVTPADPPSNVGADAVLVDDVPVDAEEVPVAVEVEPDEKSVMIMNKIADCPHPEGPLKNKYIADLMKELMATGDIHPVDPVADEVVGVDEANDAEAGMLADLPGLMDSDDDYDSDGDDEVAMHSAAVQRAIRRKKKASSSELRGDRVDQEDFDQARAKEMKSWLDTGAYDVVEDKGQDAVTTRWVYTLKDGGSKAKARLVARGFQDKDIDLLDTSSPTCSKTNVRMALVIASSMGWTPNSIDISTAFLQGKPLERTVYLKPPSTHYDGPPNVLWKLRKSVYGLNDAPRLWFESLTDLLKSVNGQFDPTDPAFMWWHDSEGTLMGIMCLHVDDILWSGTTEFNRTVVDKLRKAFPIGKESKGDFVYCGLQIHTLNTSEGIVVTVDQLEYVQRIEGIPLQKEDRQSDVLANKPQHEAYMELVGKLLWAASQTRPDIAFLVMRLSQHTKCPTLADLHKANSVLKRAQRDKVVFRYEPIKLSDMQLVAYSDAAWANLDSGKTGGGYLLGLADSGRNQLNLITWRCRALRRVVRSTMAGETIALGDLLDEVEVFGSMWRNLFKKPLRATAFTDCRSLYDHIHFGKQVTEKRLRCELYALREAQKEKKMQVEWVESGDQLADALTKNMVAFKLINVINTARLKPVQKKAYLGLTQLKCATTRRNIPVDMGYCW